MEKSDGGRELRIGFVSIRDATDVTTWSGIPFHILSELRAQGVEVEVLSPLETKAKYAVAPARLIAKARGKSVTLDHFPFVQRAYARQIERFLKARSIDVVFSPSTIPVTLLECRQPIVTWTDAVFHSMQNYYSSTFSNLTSGAVARGNRQEETALGRCCIAAYSSTWAMEAAGRITDGRKLRLLPFGSSIPVRHTADDISRQARDKRLNRKGRCELLFVGMNWERKGGQTAVETAQLLNDAGIATTLRVVGKPPQGEFPDFVEFLGVINKNSNEGLERLVDLYRSADFFILPTKAEAAGIVFSEASSFGLPSLTYATGGVPDYVKNGVNGECFAPGTPASQFAESIKRMLLNTDEYEALSAKAFLEYRNRLNWEKSVEQLIQFCKDCIEAQ